jgi:acyl-CoA reductase-like NAD-dependent aldehyde dehydrogenase
VLSSPSQMLKCISPIDNSTVCERPLATEEQMRNVLASAAQAQALWRDYSLEERIQMCSSFVDKFIKNKSEVAKELTMQMGRPIKYTPKEVDGFAERARYMISIAENCLKDILVQDHDGLSRFIKKEPIGVILIIFAWNYPYLTAVNTLIPALLAGNAVILKSSNRTPLVAERLVQLGKQAGFPSHLLQVNLAPLMQKAIELMIFGLHVL